MFCQKHREGRSSLDTSEEAKLKVLYPVLSPHTILVHVHVAVPGWVVVQLLLTPLHSWLETDSHDGYRMEHGHHLPREMTGPDAQVG